MCLLPALVLGVLPLLLWLIVPADVKWLSRFLFTFAALGLLYGAGDTSVRAIAWKAQVRLCQKYRSLVSKGKSSGVAVTAVARELLGFIWAIAREVEQQGINRQRAA